MAPYPPQTTARLWVDYSDGLHNHSAMFRFATIAGTGNAMDGADEFLTALSPDLVTITILGARAAAEGSVISVPLIWTGAAVYGSGAQTGVNEPKELCFVGRTGLGTMAKWFMYGSKAGIPNSYRYFPGELASLDAGVAALRGRVTDGTWVAIDTQPPSVYPYINIQWNSYWESQQRR
jgi:hypothetical protein